jgi:hypothetical protein
MRRTTSLLAAALCLPLTGCFEDPVREHLHLTLHGAGPVIVTVVQAVSDPELAQNNEQLADRMEASRDAIESGLDPWSRRFAELSPLAERQSLERLEGRLRRAVHSAVLASFDDAVRIVEADGLTGSLALAGGAAELALYPTGGTRATYAQRQDVERRLAEWSVSLAEYFAAAIEVYAYLDGRPDRALPCLAHILEKHDGAEATGPLAEDEEALVRRVKEAMDRVVEALLVDDGATHSLNELARLVYDPFPARLTISVKGRVLGSEGLIAGPGHFERPPVDAWTALAALEGRWLAPDLVTALASPAPEDRQPDPDPVAFAALQRSFGSAPTPSEVASALLSELVPVPVSALRWAPPPAPAGEPAADAEAWLARMAEAEASVPD